MNILQFISFEIIGRLFLGQNHHLLQTFNFVKPRTIFCEILSNLNVVKSADFILKKSIILYNLK